jgi:hypothetical protein
MMSYPAMHYPLDGSVELKRAVLKELATTELTANAYRVMLLLIALSNDTDGLVRFTLDEFALELGLTRQTVGLAVKVLIDNDLCQREGPGRYLLHGRFLPVRDENDESVLELYPPRSYTASRVAPATRAGKRKLHAVPVAGADIR